MIRHAVSFEAWVRLMTTDAFNLQLYSEVFASFGAGASEREIATFVAERYADAGGDGLTMLVVGSGVRSAAVNG